MKGLLHSGSARGGMEGDIKEDENCLIQSNSEGSPAYEFCRDLPLLSNICVDINRLHENVIKFLNERVSRLPRPLLHCMFRSSVASSREIFCPLPTDLARSGKGRVGRWSRGRSGELRRERPMKTINEEKETEGKTDAVGGLGEGAGGEFRASCLAPRFSLASCNKRGQVGLINKANELGCRCPSR